MSTERDPPLSGEENTLAAYEVVGAPQDRALITALARWLAQYSGRAMEVKAYLRQMMDETPSRGHILAALRRSPLVGSGVDLGRELASERHGSLD